MKKLILIVVACFLVTGTAYSYDKITPIKGTLLICTEGSGEKCPEKIFDPFIMSSPIKFLTRKHLDLILREQQLQMSGLTDKEKTIRMGKLLGASHILLYNKEAEESYGNMAILIRLQLINVETSEIEFTDILRWHANENGDKYMGMFFKRLTEHQGSR
ncbi:MAG: hypothetical protein WCH07_11015 [Deltaproteobacteria bacterium]